MRKNIVKPVQKLFGGPELWLNLAGQYSASTAPAPMTEHHTSLFTGA